jgi:hypothetical protein
LYNLKPKLKDESRLLMHNIVIKGTKQWETINSFRTDNGKQFSKMLVLKKMLQKARELALERNATINVVVSKD